MILKLPAVTISAFGRKVGGRLDPKGGGFNRGDDNPLDCDLLVVDETSMIDVMLMQPLMKAVPDRLRRAGGNCQRVVNRVLSLPLRSFICSRRSTGVAGKVANWSRARLSCATASTNAERLR